MSEFSPRTGCPMCGIIASASHMAPNSPRTPSFPPGSTQAEVLWRDENFTAYREKANPVSSKGHIIIAFNLHVPSIYRLSSTDLPLLVNIRNLATRLLNALLPASTPVTPSTAPPPFALQNQANHFRIGFITPPFKDNKIPVTDHLHAHAFVGTPDLAGWWRAVAYSPVAWYAIDDLIAEIRESTTNNRIKSGYENRVRAPIDMVPGAGAREGRADGVETTTPGIAHPHSLSSMEDGESLTSPTSTSSVSSSSNSNSQSLSPQYLTPQSQIPHLRV